ncbi:DNA cytosine methyltransferase [Chryseobacterium sp. C-71]|uniref:DNA cytosine methyltransferase n=1 Tax=Chryseobacterium sp. C-71 TaxID=2893882 RepID=UPI001E43FA3D|nr:DNA cytosine methyltransferase [Chryseobacterium sp. C-71]UFH31639.1 DNA cytosine methyltransferase [Chryseobacterium sp. C-71]
MNNNALTAIDLFSGAGGMSVGAVMAGIEVKIAIEYDKHAVETFKTNHPDTEVINEDIRKVVIDKSYKEPFIIFGGPPCQGFSTSNTKTRNTENINNSLFHEYIRQIKEMNPKWFVFENVEGITTFESGKVIAKLKETFTTLGYKTEWKILKASDYGVPQNRNRFFMVGNRIGIDFIFPEKKTETYNVFDAISDLPVLSNGATHIELEYKTDPVNSYMKLMRGSSKKATQNFVSRNKQFVIDRYKYIQPGQNWKAIPDELMTNYKNTNNCHSGIYKRLNPNEPSIVIANYRKNMLIHPFEDRGLSVREAARIQSFPDNFEFKGSLTYQQQQIGNAVPPLLAKALFEQIIKLSSANEY